MAWKTRKLRSGWGKIRERLDAGGSDMCRWGWRAFSRIRLGRAGLLLLPLRCARGLSNSRLRPSRQERRTGAANRWLRFLNLIKRSTPTDKEIHIICDNYATHKHQKVKAWQKRNPRFHFHFTQQALPLPGLIW